MNPDRVIPGQVVQADDDDNNGQARPQETFLHKVASGPLGPVGASMSGRHAMTGLRDEDDEAEVTDSDDDTEVMPAPAATAATASTVPAGYPAEADDIDAAAGDTAEHDLAANDAADADMAASGTADAYAADADVADADVADDGTADDDAADDDATAATAEADSATVDVAEVDATEAGVPVVATRTEAVDETYTTDETDISGATGIPVETDTTGAIAAADVESTAADMSTAADTDVAETRADMSTAPASTAPDDGDGDEPLLGEAAGRIREEWRQVQASFVDDPRASVTSAAGVVADAAARLESLLRERQRSLRGSRDGNGQADTETLRQLMLTYRRLLTKLIS